VATTWLNLQRKDKKVIKHDNYTQEIKTKKISVWRTSLSQYKRRSIISRLLILLHQMRRLKTWRRFKQRQSRSFRKNLRWLFQTQLNTKSFRKAGSKSKSIQSRSMQTISQMIQRSVVTLDLARSIVLLQKVCKILNLRI